MEGIDISEFQQTQPPAYYANLGFVVAKATEGSTYTDPSFAAKYAAFRESGNTHVGAYHYARPGDGTSGTVQANHFADVALAAGFEPGVDIWMLDCEQGQNANVAPGVWVTFAGQFRAQAEARLGKRGLLYVGYYDWLKIFNGQHEVISQWSGWWLPWYGPNDGQLHEPTALLPQAPLVQQYTSLGGLDRDFASDGAWSTWLTETEPVPPPDLNAIHEIVVFLQDLAHRPAKLGDRGDQVKRVNELLAKNGYPEPLEGGGDAYGAETEKAVAAFKAKYHLPNRDGKVCGRFCAIELFRHSAK